MKLYREVKCSDRLPDEQNDYMTDQGWVGWDCDQESFGYWSEEYPAGPEEFVEIRIEWWLEPYELPTEEEIFKIAKGPVLGGESLLFDDEARELAKRIAAYLNNAQTQ